MISGIEEGVYSYPELLVHLGPRAQVEVFPPWVCSPIACFSCACVQLWLQLSLLWLPSPSGG